MMHNPVSIRSSLAIVGVGNGGGKVVQTIARNWPDGPRMVAVNTDLRALSGLEGLEGLHIGGKVLRGMGTGGDPRIAKQAAESDIEKLRGLFDGVEMAIFAVGLGGGTGTGVAPFLIDEAKKAGALTLCFVMFPFDFEGLRRRETAECGLQAIKDVADGVICLPNQRLVGLMEDKANIQEAFDKADGILAAGIREFWRVLNRSSMINFDFADLRSFLHNSDGNCIFCCAEGDGGNRVAEILEGIRQNVMFNNCETLAAAGSFIVCIIGGTNLSISDAEKIVRGISALGRKNALVMTGVGFEPEWRDKIHVTILATETAALSGRRDPGKPEMRQRDDEPKSHPAAHPEPGKTDMIQTDLFSAVDIGRFKGVNPTIVDGNNLDIPTYIRWRIPIQKAKIANI